MEQTPQEQFVQSKNEVIASLSASFKPRGKEGHRTLQMTIEELDKSTSFFMEDCVKRKLAAKEELWLTRENFPTTNANKAHKRIYVYTIGEDVPTHAPLFEAILAAADRQRSIAQTSAADVAPESIGLIQDVNESAAPPPKAPKAARQNTPGSPLVQSLVRCLTWTERTGGKGTNFSVTTKPEISATAGKRLIAEAKNKRLIVGDENRLNIVDEELLRAVAMANKPRTR